MTNATIVNAHYVNNANRRQWNSKIHINKHFANDNLHKVFFII